MFLQYIKNEPILIKMDRKICEKIMDVFENVFFFFCKFLNGPDHFLGSAFSDPTSFRVRL